MQHELATDEALEARAAQLDASLATTLARLPDGWQKSKGTEAGQQSAADELTERAGAIDDPLIREIYTGNNHPKQAS